MFNDTKNKLLLDQLIFTTANLVVYQVIADGTIVAINPAVKDVTGFLEGELEGTSIYEWLPGLKDIEYQSFTSVISHGEIEFLDTDDDETNIDDPQNPLERFIRGTTEFDHLKHEQLSHNKRGEALWFDARINRFEQPEQDLYVVICTDISQRKEREQQILELNLSLEDKVKQRTRALQKSNTQLNQTLEQLERTTERAIMNEKMSSLVYVIRNIAHEMNTPLGIILSAASTYSEEVHKIVTSIEEGSLSKNVLTLHLNNQMSCSEIIDRSLEKLVAIIDSLKSIVPEGDLEGAKPIQLEELLVFLARDFKKKTGKELSLQYEPNLSFDSQLHLLMLTINQLLDNAITHAFPDTKIGNVGITVDRAEDTIVIKVSDDGIGISEENLQSIYTPFFTTVRAEKNAIGLGLASVYNVVEYQLHGHIECHSILGQGTSFTITLPIRG